MFESCAFTLSKISKFIYQLTEKASASLVRSFPTAATP